MGGSSSEEAAELVATIRGEHVVMKTWFNGSSTKAMALREKYGPYPGLWKEVLNWPGWKEARKAYLKHSQGGGSGGNTPANSEPSTSHTPKSKDSVDVPRKRRSRWGSADHNDNSDSGSNKRRSRWGRDDAADTSKTAAPPGSSVPGHYGPSGGGGTAPLLAPLPGLGLPGMPANLSPQQQQEMKALQGRLRDINEKLDNLEQEAARVDALPRHHPDRSPSPPPGEFAMFCFSLLCPTFL
jgi:hypothetical protein